MLTLLGDPALTLTCSDLVPTPPWIHPTAETSGPPLGYRTDMGQGCPSPVPGMQGVHMEGSQIPGSSADKNKLSYPLTQASPSLPGLAAKPTSLEVGPFTPA